MALARAKEAIASDCCEAQREEAMASLAQAKAKVLSFTRTPFSCRNLGVDFLAGKSKRRVSLPTRDARYRAMQKRAKRMCCLQRSSKRLAAKVFITGILPSILYDAPILGLFWEPSQESQGQSGAIFRVQRAFQELCVGLLHEA